MRHHVVNPYQPARAVIKEIKKETHDTTTYTLCFADQDVQQNYSFKPGQFNMLSVLGVGEAPISISSRPGERGFFQHTIRHVGNVTNSIGERREGDAIWIRGAYGNGWPVDFLPGKNVLIVSGGIGLAPLRPVILELVRNREKYGRVEVLYGARTPDDMLFTDEFAGWGEKIRFLQTVDAVPSGFSRPLRVGVVTRLFEVMESTPEDTIALTCGPEIMMKFVVIDLLRFGFNPRQIYVSLERRMSCGVKKCGNCQLGSKFVCRDGPVFPYAGLLTLVEDVLGCGGHLKWQKMPR